MTNITELIRNLRTKNGDYSAKLPHLHFEEGIDQQISSMEYDYIDDILKLNQDLKIKLKTNPQ
jgi:hypothetical protein